MPELILLRHAKSDWGAGFVTDRDRPLARRGEKAAYAMGRALTLAGKMPDLVISSPAVRAETTARLAAQAGEWPARIDLDERLYGASPVDVALVEQSEEMVEIRRRVSLVVRCTGQEACFARSTIPLSANGREVLTDVREGVLGIGQIAVKHHIPTERRIREIDVTPSQISRKYVMQGPGLYYVVTEVFPRELYR